jgi:Asp-tRNA(Asn)/Glu-tRNA(Gln) amidotransferase A subunit family amidase
MQTPFPSLRELIRLLDTGELTPIQLVRQCLDRVAHLDKDVHAWVRVDAEGAIQAAQRRTGRPTTGLLHGLPAGIKDTIDVAGLPTECGSVVRTGQIADTDSWVVDRLRTAGMIVLGKTVATEFAYFSPGPTRNPHDLGRTPGGSSSGSAAAVAAGMVPFALGTQTAGSIVRPASFCGIAGYVPPVGAFPMTGISPLSTTLDSVGVLARSVADLELVRAALLGHRAPPPQSELAEPRLLVADGAVLAAMDPGFPESLASTVSLLARHGARITPLPSAVDLAALPGPHATVLAFEAPRVLRFAPAERAQLSIPLQELLDLGMRTARADYEQARQTIAHQRSLVLALLSEHDAILAPAAVGAAPTDLRTTGDPVMSRPWQAMGLPAVAVPGLHDSKAMPLGIQLIGHPQHESRLFGAARWLADRLPMPAQATGIASFS